MAVWTLADRLLRNPREVAARRDASVWQLVVLTALGALAFGTAVGIWRGPLQAVFSGGKMPLVFLLPVLISLPGIRAIYASCGARANLRQMAFASLVGTTRTALLATALSPGVWLVYSLDPPYELAVLTLAGALGLAGLPGLALVHQAMPSGGRPRRILAGVAAFGILAAVTAQTGWVLRPFVGQVDAPVMLFAPLRGDVLQGLQEPSIVDVSPE